MRTILVLTDLSENAANAACSAAIVAANLQTNIPLFNACATAPICISIKHFNSFRV
jgi:hypothetical protein